MKLKRLYAKATVQHRDPEENEVSVYAYRHIFVYLPPGCTVASFERTICKKGKKYAVAMSKSFTNLKFKSMSKKTLHPKKNKPTKKKSSAQKKADPKKKAR